MDIEERKNVRTLSATEIEPIVLNFCITMYFLSDYCRATNIFTCVSFGQNTFHTELKIPLALITEFLPPLVAFLGEANDLSKY